MTTRDMYGNMIRVNDNNDAGGFGVSLTYQGRGSDGRMLPMFTVFHESDDFRQALFSIVFEHEMDGFVWPETTNTFERRVAEVLKLMPEAARQT